MAYTVDALYIKATYKLLGLTLLSQHSGWVTWLVLKFSLGSSLPFHFGNRHF